MKKLFSLVVIAAALIFAGTAKAQYSNPNDPCNIQYAASGVPQQNLTVYVNMQLTGNTTGLSASDLQTVIADGILLSNQGFEAAGEGVRLTQTTDVSTANLILNLNVVYESDGTGTAYLEMRGLGVGHLFKFHRVRATAGDAAVAIFSDLHDYLGNRGWTCGSGDGN